MWLLEHLCRACTSPSYARWGIPSKHIFAVLFNGTICVNMKLHFHPVYHLCFMNDLDFNAVTEFTVAGDDTTGTFIMPDETTCWNWGQYASKDTWDLIGLGGPALNGVAYPTANSLKQAPESIAEKTKKALNHMAPYINQSSSERSSTFTMKGFLKGDTIVFLLLAT